MAKFAKAEAKQAKLKIGQYGKAGTGKTLTALLFAEWLANKEGKRIAFVDTERGTDFYAKAIPERAIHPAAFDFDAIYTRSISETIEAIEGLDPKEHGVVVIDSITHMWEAAIAAYTGKKTSIGSIPAPAWGGIKKPYKKLMTFFLDGPFHAILCGRSGVAMEENAEGETVVVGTRMKAEGETPHEPHLLLRFESERDQNGGYVIGFFCEKDRSGILTGRRINNPTPAAIEPIYGYLGGEQGQTGSLDDAAVKDAAAAEAAIEREAAERQSLADSIRGAILASTTLDALRSAWELTKGRKARLGDLYETLEALKDARKSELVQKVA